jgi:outer membrane protein assembly factor BamB
LLYLINDRGIMSAIDVKSGKAVYGRQRLPSGTYSGSPVLADGKIYITNEDGMTSVVKAGPTFEILSRNNFDEYTLSSPAVSEGQIFIRTEAFLYCIGQRARTAKGN